MRRLSTASRTARAGESARTLSRLAEKTRVDAATLARMQSRSALTRAAASLESDDAVLERVRLSRAHSLRLAYLSSLVSPDQIEKNVLSRLKSDPAQLLSFPGARVITGSKQVMKSLLEAHVVLEYEGRLYSLFVKDPEGRQVNEPSTERAVFGSKDAFVEMLDQNLGLIRQHAHDPDLRVDLLEVGTKAPTRIAVLSVRDLAPPEFHAWVVQRIETHPVPRLPFVSHLIAPLFGKIWSPFLPASFTERPDVVLDHLYRGRIAVLADGSPFALMAPKTWMDDQREEENHLLSPITRIFIYLLRLSATFSATALPGFYVAVLTGNPNFLPGLLSISVASTREAVPYPVITETLFLMFVFDILAESTVAMKGVLGPSISIVGSLIIGDAAVRANLASNLSVIVVAGTALGTFVTPHYWSSYGFRIWKYPIIGLAGLLGIMGWTVGVVWLVTHLAATRTLGVSYASAFSRGHGNGATELFRVSPSRSTLPDPHAHT